jgi:hypothetical protein
MIYEIRRSQEASATDHDQFFRQASRELFWYLKVFALES